MDATVINKDLWNLCNEDIEHIDNIPQKLKEHCLENVYEDNHHINLWKSVFNDTEAFQHITNNIFILYKINK